MAEELFCHRPQKFFFFRPKGPPFLFRLGQNLDPMQGKLKASVKAAALDIFKAKDDPSLSLFY